MANMGVLRSGMAWASILLGAMCAQATTVDFASALPLGNLPESVTASGIIVSGWKVTKVDNTQWSSNVILNNRNQGPAEFGLGVCANPTNCPAINNGDINEIDNNGSTFDVIRLDLGSPTLLNSINLSSLDSGLKDGFAIFGSNTALPNLGMLGALAQGTNTSVGSVTPTVMLNSTFRYFFVAPKDRGVNDSGSDYLLRGLTTGVVVQTVPEPMSAGLLGVGLIGLGLLRRKRANKVQS